MRKLLFAVALFSGAAQAQNFGAETRVLTYWQKSFIKKTERTRETKGDPVRQALVATP